MGLGCAPGCQREQCSTRRALNTVIVPTHPPASSDGLSGGELLAMLEAKPGAHSGARCAGARQPMLRCGAGVNYANLQKIDLKRSLIHLSIYGLISAFLLLWQSGAPAQTQPPSAPTVAGQVPATADAARVKSDQIRRGEYVARLGDCVACHTAPGGKPMAGGLELKTPFGALYSTNITPDRETGIGNYSFEQFDRSVREGVAADGHNLYSAMPYPSYAKMNEQDLRDLYAYLMEGQPPVSQANQPSEMSWPFSMRWGLSLWNWVFLDKTRFQPDQSRDAAWNRGAYLIQGPGHCGACHTPRGFGFQEKAMTHAGGDRKSVV